MKKSYESLLDDLEALLERDSSKISDAAKRLIDSKKELTKLVLDEATQTELKKIAVKQGIPYPLLLRLLTLGQLDESAIPDSEYEKISASDPENDSAED